MLKKYNSGTITSEHNLHISGKIFHNCVYILLEYLFQKWSVKK